MKPFQKGMRRFVAMKRRRRFPVPTLLGVDTRDAVCLVNILTAGIDVARLFRWADTQTWHREFRYEGEVVDWSRVARVAQDWALSLVRLGIGEALRSAAQSVAPTLGGRRG